MDTPSLIGTAEAARILGVDRSTLVRQVDAGKVAPVQKLGAATGAYVFDRAYVQRLAAERAA